jgi:E3 ubiquitin-protein ligase synoviolin
MFAFEFAILLITSTGILSRYIISLAEKYILHREAARRKAARTVERAAARQRRQTQREENERRRAAGDEIEPVEDEDEDEDEDDEELDVGGWEEKGTWVFYSELCTGMLC